MSAKIEEIIFQDHCKIDLESLTAKEKVDPGKILVGLQKYEEIVASIKEEYPKLNDFDINIILLQYGPQVKENLKTEEVRLKEGYIKTKGGR